MERAVSKHKALLVDAKLLALTKLENAVVQQVRLLKQAFHQLESELEDGESSYHRPNKRKVSKKSASAVSVTTESSSRIQFCGFGIDELVRCRYERR